MFANPSAFAISFPVFEPYKDSKVDTLAPKLLFIALNLAGMGLGVWKVSCANSSFFHTLSVTD